MRTTTTTTTTTVRREGGGPPPPLSFAHFLPLLILLVSSSVADIHAAMAMAKTTTVGGRTAAIRRAMAGDDPTTRQGDDENDGDAADEDFPTQSPTTNPTEVPLADCFLLSLSEGGCADAGPDCEWWTDDGAAAAGAVVVAVVPADPGATAPPTAAPPPSICRIACDALSSRSSAEIDCLSTSHCEWIALFGGGGGKEDGDPHCRARVICVGVYEKGACKDASPTCEWDDDAGVCGVATMAPTSESPTTASPTTDGPTTSPPTTDAPTATSAPTVSPSASARPTAAPVASPTATPSDSAAPSVRPTHGPSASASPSAYPTDTPHPSDHPTSSRLPTRADYVYVRPEINDVRFVTWNELSRDKQLAASDGLRYTRETWDVPGTNPIEFLRYDDLSDGQREAAGIIGFVDGISWNCWQNHWESFSWKQLQSLEITPYLTAFWDVNSWNAQYGDPPMPRAPSTAATTTTGGGAWSDLTDEQKLDARQLCHHKTSYDRLDLNAYGGYGYPLARPMSRFVPWEDMDEGARTILAENLGYTELTWNVHRLAEVESSGHFELMYFESDAAETVLGLDQVGWDCWINHYDSYGWADLEGRGLAGAMSGLGWNEASWEGGADPPPSDSKSWNELTEDEQLHATDLCLYRENWDMIDMTRNDGPFPFPMPTLRYTAWEALSPEQRRIAENVFLYDETTWNDVGFADIEKRAWDDLTVDQQPIAIQLGLYSRTWDCYQNHYRGTRWDGLSQNVTNAAISLGWDENVWSEPQGEPASYGRKWSELSEEEKIAAHALCHFDVTWPGDGTSINLLNRPDESANDASQIFAHMSLLPAVLGIVTAALYVQT